MPFDSTPRTAATFSSMPFAGTTAPGRPSTPTRPARALGAPHTTVSGAPAVDVRAGLDGQHLQLVGLRMFLRGQHARDTETRELLGRILDAFDLVTDAVERRDNIGDAIVAFDMLAEPVEGDLHAEIPPLSVGTDSAPNP